MQQFIGPKLHHAQGPHNEGSLYIVLKGAGARLPFIAIPPPYAAKTKFGLKH